MKEKDSQRRRTIGRRIKESDKQTRKPKKQTKKREFKPYTEYVYTKEEQLDDTTVLVELTKEDLEYNKKVHELLEVGKAYKYKELCELLEESTKTGDSKQVQLSKWWQHFDWSNPTTQKFLVTEIFDTPRQRIDTRRQLEHFKEKELESNLIFTMLDAEARFLLTVLDKDNFHEEVGDYGLITGIPARAMYKSIGLVNSDYYYIRSQKEVLADWLPIEEQQAVYRDIDESSKRYTMGALKRLHRSRAIIDYSYTYIWVDMDNNQHLATDEEHLTIANSIEKTIKFAQESGYNSVKSICNLYDGTLKDYEAKDLQQYLLDLIKQKIPQLGYFYRAYKLVYLKDSMLKYINSVASLEGLELSELSILKRKDSHKEHAKIQTSKAKKRNNKNKEKEIKLINTVVDLPTEENLSDRQLILDKIKIQQQIERLVKQHKYEEAQALIQALKTYE